MKRTKNGQFAFKPFKRSNWSGLILLISIMSLSAYLNYRFQPVELHRPLVGEVKAQELPVQTIMEAPKTIKDQAIEYIYQIFGDDADEMITIIGTCENKGWNPKAVNTNKNGSKDYNLAQVNDLNGRRDKQCAGLDYRNNWKDNLDCAKIIRDSQGLKAWSCSYTVGVDPFYMRSK